MGNTSRPGVNSLFDASQWIAWLGAALVAGFYVVSFVYSTFETKAASTDQKTDIVARIDRMDAHYSGQLNRMEDKLDQALEHKKK